VPFIGMEREESRWEAGYQRQSAPQWSLFRFDEEIDGEEGESIDGVGF
jgi:hypothetical protein